jgi:hypothetical protein
MMAKSRRRTPEQARREEEWADKPENRARQAARMRARRKMEKEGRVSKNDGKEVDHKNFNPKDNSDKNLRVVSRRTNRKRQPK